MLMMQVQMVQKVVVLVVVRGNRHGDDGAGVLGAWYRCAEGRHARFRVAAGARCWRHDHAWEVRQKKRRRKKKI